MSEATIYNSLKQEQIARGEIERSSTEQALEPAAANERINSSKPNWRFAEGL